MRSIFALILRRIRTKYATSRAGYIWAIVEPICWVFILKFAIQDKGSGLPPIGGSYEVFFATGVIIARTWRTVAQSTSGVLLRRKRMLPGLQRLDAAYATWILEMATGGVAMLVVLAGMALFGFETRPAHLLICLAAFAATALYTFGFSLMLALVMSLAPGLRHFQHIIMLALFITSGFSMLIDRVPPRIREILLWNPLLHCIEWFREGFYQRIDREAPRSRKERERKAGRPEQHLDGDQ
ncbi:ABC transporter permease [Hansschlegelia beijingensis]